MWNAQRYNDETMREVYHTTNILRKPIRGIVSGYHELPYILVAPNNENDSSSIQINGKINVSPKFILSAETLGEAFGDVFDPSTFNEAIQARLFSFAYHKGKNFRLENEKFEIRNFEEKPGTHIERVHDELMREENVLTALIFGPRFDYYPVSIDRYINEILDREFRL